MKARRKYTHEQIVSILQKHHGGVTAKETIRRHGISLDTFYCWKPKYGGLGKTEAAAAEGARGEFGEKSECAGKVAGAIVTGLLDIGGASALTKLGVGAGRAGRP